MNLWGMLEFPSKTNAFPLPQSYLLQLCLCLEEKLIKIKQTQGQRSV